MPVFRPWPGFRWLRRAWFGVLGLLLCVSPFMMADYCVMIPTGMAIVAAFGPLNHLAGRKVTCRRCGLDGL